MGSFISGFIGMFGGGGDKGAVLQAQDRARKAAADTSAAKAKQEQAQLEMQKNFAANLGIDNKAEVVAGGSAEALGAGDTAASRRRKQQTNLASTLGINT